MELTIVISEELAAKIHEARDLLSHIEEAHGVEFVIDRAVTKLVETEKRRRFGVGHFPGVPGAKNQGLSARNEENTPSDSEHTPPNQESTAHESLPAEHLPPGTSGRYIAVAVRRQVRPP